MSNKYISKLITRYKFKLYCYFIYLRGFVFNKYNYYQNQIYNGIHIKKQDINIGGETCEW